MKQRFDGKSVLVTGAASGIGLATAQGFASEGANLMIADIDGQGAAKAAAQIEASGGRAASVAVDLRDAEACAGMVDAVLQQFGRLDIAVNNAGVNDAPYDEFENIVLEEWNRVLSTNVGGLFNAMKAQVPAMRQTGGDKAIVNTASAASISAVPGKAAYVTSKHAVAGLTRAAALDLIRHNIRVNAVCPGLTETPMIATATAQVELQQALVAGTPIKRIAKPEEVAAAILFLASEEASYVMGSLMAVDGGLTAA